MSIKYKLMISYMLIIVISLSILGLLIGNKSQDIVFNEVTEKSVRISDLIYNIVSVRNNLLTEKVESDLYYIEKLINNLGELRIDDKQQIQIGNYKIPSIYAGSTNLILDTSLIDDIKESIGGVTSIFLIHDTKLIRVATNFTIDGKSVIGTYIKKESEIYRNIINNKSYEGRVVIESERFIGGYTPIVDSTGKVIGAIGLGYKEMNKYLEDTLNDIKIGQTGYVYIMNSKGEVLAHPNIKNQNIGNLDFSRKIINKKNGRIEYEYEGVNKLAAYRYFEPWDWYIVSTANYDDLKSSSNSVLNIIIITVIVVLLIGIMIALFLTKNIVKPINKLKDCMEIAGKGNLSVYCDINSKDEIGILSNSFNNMIKENKNLVDKIIKHDKLKTTFFANISHELKTPLNIIFSTTQLFDLYIDDDKNFNIKKFNKNLYAIKQNCYRLMRLINNLIDVTKIDSGFIKLSLKNENIVAIIEDITQSSVHYIENKSRILIFDTDIEEKIMAIDSEIMEKIILNLISNAVKFTKPGDKIEVTIYDKGENIMISVKDTGKGIPESEQQEIFKRFKQVEPLLNRSHEGSGIGLSLVKSLVEMHNGKISVKSECGKGSEFIIELPCIIIPEENDEKTIDNNSQQINVEKIKIEFSDIYD